ncbi:DUF3617 domain-containing protein [Halomonas salifodinae]|uniref:DUF3617 domain-containing protein n=1 Tax=Halomonas salifodinae TaxID=438745 RepID=A0ABW2EYX9_9GAMM
MLPRVLLLSAALALPLAAQAEAPDLLPGQWEFTSTTTVEGDMPIPDQNETHQECLTQDEIDEAPMTLIEEEEGCELLEQDVSAAGMDYRMRCTGEGGEADIVGSMSYLQDRAEGTMRVEMTTPMGEMVMNTEIQAERLGDC